MIRGVALGLRAVPQLETQDHIQGERDEEIAGRRTGEHDESGEDTSILIGEEPDVERKEFRVKLATRDDLWEEEMEDLPSAKMIFDPLITVEVIIGGISMKAVIDTGATYSCISHELYEKLIAMKSIKSELPTSKIQLITAVGKRRIKVNKQVWVEVILNAKGSDIMMFVVPGLFTRMLMGLNWLRESRVMIDCGNGTVYYKEGSTEALERGTNGKAMEMKIEEGEKHIMTSMVAERRVDLDWTRIGERQDADMSWKSVKEQCDGQETMEIKGKLYRVFGGVLFMEKTLTRNRDNEDA